MTRVCFSIIILPTQIMRGTIIYTEEEAIQLIPDTTIS